MSIKCSLTNTRRKKLSTDFSNSNYFIDKIRNAGRVLCVRTLCIARIQNAIIQFSIEVEKPSISTARRLRTFPATIGNICINPFMNFHTPIQTYDMQLWSRIFIQHLQIHSNAMIKVVSSTNEHR